MRWYISGIAAKCVIGGCWLSICCSGGDLESGLCPDTVVNNDPWLSVQTYLFDLSGMQAPVEWDEQGPEAHARELHLEHPGMILGDQRNPVTVTDAESAQRGGKACHPLLEFGPRRSGSVFGAAERERIRAVLRVVIHPVGGEEGQFCSNSRRSYQTTYEWY